MILDVSDRLYWLLVILVVWHICDLVMSWVFSAYEAETTLRELLFNDGLEEEEPCSVV